MTAAKGLPEFTVYSRPGCHLCEQLIESLLPLLRGRAGLQVQNIDEDDELLQRYGTRIPVVEWRGEWLCEYRLDPSAIRRALAESG